MMPHRWEEHLDVHEGSCCWPGMPMYGGGSTAVEDYLSGGRSPGRSIAISRNLSNAVPALMQRLKPASVFIKATSISIAFLVVSCANT